MKHSLEELERLASEATPGRWEVDSEETDGEYGSGPDCRSGYHTFAVFADGKRICGAENTSDGEIHEEYDEEGCFAWDDVAKRNMAFIAAAREAVPDLIQRVRELEASLAQALGMMSDAAHEAGKWKGRYEAAGYPATLDMWIEHAKKLEARIASMEKRDE